MTRDLGGHSPDPDVAVRGRWRLLLGDRRMSRAAPVAPVDEDTQDLGTKREWALAKQAWDAEMLLQRALMLVDERLPQATDRKHQNDLLDLKNLLTGKATS